MTGTKKKWWAAAAPPLLLLFQGGCTDHEMSRAELEGNVEYLQAQLHLAQEKAEILTTASSSLEDEVLRLDNENWADVVPALREASDEVGTATEELVEALE